MFQRLLWVAVQAHDSLCVCKSFSPRRTLQDTMPAATAKLLHELHPDLAAAALPAQASAPVATAAATAAAPASAEGGEEMVSVPRGYLDYLESLVSRCMPGVAAPEGPAAAASAAVANGSGAGMDADEAARVASIAPATLQVLMQSNK